MKYFEFSNGKTVLAYMFVLSCFLTMGNVQLEAQCSLSCNGTTQVSLSATCNAIITPNMILSDDGTSCTPNDFSVVVSDDYGPIAGGDEVSGDYMGQTLTAMVLDDISGNSCWGYIIIEDKLGPKPMIADCPIGPVVTMDCADMNAYQGPIFTDNCDGDLIPVLVSEDIETPCHANIIKIVKRTYKAQDNKGNMSANDCTVTFRLRRFNFNRVRFPDSLLVNNNTALSCSVVDEYDTNGNGRIDQGEIPPDSTGVPFYIVNLPPPGPAGGRERVDLYPYPDIYCNSIVTFEDTVLPKIGCTQKIMRRWKINEWHCMGERDSVYVQVIEITDSYGPELEIDVDGRCVINGSSNITLTTNTLIGNPASGNYQDFNCGAKVNLPLPNATDNCNAEPHFDLTFNSGFIKDYNGSEVTLPMGTNVVLYQVYDDCYNSTQCHLTVNIIDNTPPIAICDQNTSVSLTTGGTAVVAAESFNDGSYDDCKLHCALVRRMDNGTCECRTPELCNLRFLGNFNGSNYYLSDYETSSTIAKGRAAAYGGALVKLNNPDEEEWLIGTVRKSYAGSFWIGLKRHANSFLWDDHSNPAYYNFSGGDIPETGGDCFLMDSHNEWLVTDCTADVHGSINQRYVLELPEGCGFSSGARFCCDDAQDDDHMVVFRVIDFYGNYNDCMVNIEVQDKSAPILTCPVDRTINCTDYVDINNMSIEFGDVNVGASCGSNIRYSVTELGECRVGTITRLWEAVSSNEPNAQVLSHCKQIITVQNDDLFDEHDIICPVRDTVIVGCSDPSEFGIDVMGEPTFLSDQCDFVGADYNDQVFTFNNSSGDACFKILREWKIIDWCQVDATGYRTWNCAQVIKITNRSKPVITGVKPITVCTYDSDCAFGDIELEIWAEDDCTTAANLDWTYSIFVGESGLGPVDLNNPAVTESGSGDHILVQGKFPVGSHIIRWTYFDACGNATTVDQQFIIDNCKAATAYCINGLAVDLMPIDTDNDGDIDAGMIELWASDFDAGSYHPCGYPVQLSFSSDVTETNKLFTCADVPGDKIVEIWATVVTPSGEQVQTYCSTFIDIQDNMNSCNGLRLPDSLVVNGNIVTEDAQFIENVSVSLEGSPLSSMTGNYGQYAFPDMPSGGDYVINPYSNEDPLNGVSTLDLIMIQRHLLGIESLDSPYKQIAADIDNNNQINGLDIVELRKLILGVYESLPNNDSWRFVDKGYSFINPSDPLRENYTEDYEIYNLESNMNVDFIAVKVGDVNNSVEVGLQEIVAGAITTTASTITFENQEVSQGQVVRIPFTMENRQSLDGYQVSVSFDSDKLIVLEVNHARGRMDASHYQIKENEISISWDSKVASDDALFEILAIAKESGDLSNQFDLSPAGVRSEVYLSNGSVVTPTISNTSVSSDLFTIAQNNPNPFNATTSIEFSLNEDMTLNYSIQDVEGKLVMNNQRGFTKGANTITVSKDDLAGPGIYYLTLQKGDQRQTIKMVLVD